MLFFENDTNVMIQVTQKIKFNLRRDDNNVFVLNTKKKANTKIHFIVNKNSKKRQMGLI